MAAQLVQAAAAGGPDAAGRDTQLGADLGVRHGRVFDEQGDQLLAGGGQVGERLAQRCVALGDEQFMFGHPGLVGGDVLRVQHVPARLCPARLAQDPEAFAPGGGGEPARKRGRIAEAVKLGHQVQPYVLADVLCVGAAQPVSAADGPHQRGVPFDEGVPGLLVAVPGAHHQAGD
jgi:hypothetical protein